MLFPNKFFSDLWTAAANSDCPALHAVMMMARASGDPNSAGLLSLVAVADDMAVAGEEFYEAIQTIYNRQSPKLDRGVHICPACGRESCGGATMRVKEIHLKKSGT